MAELAEVEPKTTSARGRLQFSLVVPTFNEVENVDLLVKKIEQSLIGIEWELIIVDDDSPDGTSNAVRAIANVDRRVRLVQRVGRRGLSSAVVEGILASSAPVVGVMDGDLQHDEAVLPLLFNKIAIEGNDIAVGSRYVDGGGVGEWSKERQFISKFATWLSDRVLKTKLADPMSGFFAISRTTFMESLPRLSTVGFKILLDIAASAPKPLRVADVPFTFRTRSHGESKLDSAVAWEFIIMLADKVVGHIIPVRFLLFAFVGSLGLFVHLVVLGASIHLLSLDFASAQTLAVFCAMTFNFAVNNALTYRDRRLRGSRLFFGLLSFYAVCLMGAAANVGVGTYIHNAQWTWWFAGLSGALVGAVWNYAVSSVFTWKK
jgi:dolichol-phosphate mannosyltransferase